jgi:uncharacterized protein YjbI with pentapeptide repeats
MFNTIPRLFHLTIILSTALILGISESAFSSKYPVVLESNIETPVCYIRTEDDRTFDLSSLCGRSDTYMRNTAANSRYVSKLVKTKQCPMCNLSDTNLSNVNLIGADLMNANLSNANLSNANLLGANLLGANLSNTNLSGAIMPDGSIHK